MSDHLTDAQLIERLRAHAERGSRTMAEIATDFGCKPAALRASLALAKARGLTAASKVPDELDRAKIKIGRLEAEIKGMVRASISADEIRERIYELSRLPLDPPTWTMTAPRSLKTPGVPMTLWSDWHWGEVVEAAAVAGVNAFNRAVANERVKLLVEKTISLAKHHMVRPTYPGIVICLGGDMITGAIHQELAITNWGGVQQQVLEVTEALIWALDQMARAFGKVFVPCVVGNHGRDTMKPMFKNRVFQSYEWNIYQQLERHFRRDKRIRFMIPEEADAYFKVYDHRFLLTHGDALGVKGGDGIIGMLGPVARGAIKIGRAEAQIGRDFDTLLLGHWHTFVPRGDAVSAIVNGCLIGYNEYARLQLRVPYSRPGQALWFVHPDHGITAQWQMFLDKRRQSAQSADWLTFEQRR